MAEAVTLKPIQVAPQVYAFIGEMGNRSYANEGLNANTGFIVTPAGVVVVDSGSSYRVAQQIHRAIQTVTQRPVRYVINTGSQDHRFHWPEFSSSRCCTTTSTPILPRKRCANCSARYTERCWPPVQPNDTIKLWKPRR